MVELSDEGGRGMAESDKAIWYWNRFSRYWEAQRLSQASFEAE